MMRDVKIKNLFVMNNDNKDIEWICLTMINLNKHDDDTAMKHDAESNERPIIDIENMELLQS